MVKVVCISDTHCFHDQLDMPEGDILIHAGDFTWTGATLQIKEFNHWLGGLPYKHKIIIAGNHEIGFQDNYNLITNATYLCNSGTEIRYEKTSLKIWGSPYTPTFGKGWNFNCNRDEISKHWDLIPNDIDILITHGPPFGILDQVLRIYMDENDGYFAFQYNGKVGDMELGAAVRKIKPKLHIFGHIHEGYGVKKIDGITYLNAAIYDHTVQRLKDPLVVEI